MEKKKRKSSIFWDSENKRSLWVGDYLVVEEKSPKTIQMLATGEEVTVDGMFCIYRECSKKLVTSTTNFNSATHLAKLLNDAYKAGLDYTPEYND
jgi:hypothetical protein